MRNLEMNPNKVILFVCLAFMAFSSAIFAEEAVDVFGFTKFFPTVKGSVSWDSQHWANGKERTLGWKGDPDDPSGWTEPHFSCPDNVCFKIDGKGVMQMQGDGPRFHVNSQLGTTRQFYLNTEYTAYFKRNASGGKDWGGMVVGVRSAPLGHGSSGGDDCDASTYYGRFRNDGKWDLEKEWKHPGSYYQSSGVIGKQTPMWGGQQLPVDKWIGMKYIAYNKDAATVHLELYVDSTSGGVPPGKWEKVGEADDAGLDWSGASGGAATIDGCSYTNAFAAILEGHGTILMRSDYDNPYYKFVSIREIDPKGTFDAGEGSSSSGAPAVVDPISYPDSDPQPMPDIHIASSSSIGTDALPVAARQSFSVIAVERSLVISSPVAKNVAVFDMQGRVVFSKRGISEGSIPVRNPGSYLVMVDGIAQIVNVR